MALLTYDEMRAETRALGITNTTDPGYADRLRLLVESALRHPLTLEALAAEAKGLPTPGYRARTNSLAADVEDLAQAYDDIDEGVYRMQDRYEVLGAVNDVLLEVYSEAARQRIDLAAVQAVEDGAFSLGAWLRERFG